MPFLGKGQRIFIVVAGNMHKISLESLTVAEVGPIEIIDIAEEVGFDGVNIRIEPIPYFPVPGYDLLGDSGLRRSVASRLRNSRIEYHAADPFYLRDTSRQEDFLEKMEVAAELGVRRINSVSFDADVERRRDAFAAFSQQAAGFGLKVSVEPVRFTALNTLASAVDLVRALGPECISITLDFLHLTRMKTHPNELDRLPSEYVGYAQACDGPIDMPQERQVEEATMNRLPPGEGEFEIARYLGAVPENVFVGLEVPLLRLMQEGWGPKKRAKYVYDAMRRCQVAVG